ncbi:MAG TPA: IPT/TIG domain-containing protein [Terriglobales bacterium]|nr:IPT/TIG domain-containing protein [Terriglobales bacterium]
MKRTSAFLRLSGTLLLIMLVLQGCSSLNPLCSSARPAPSISSLSPTTITFAQVQQGFLLTVNGSHFVSSSVVVINGTTLATQVPNAGELQVTITTALISASGTASVKVTTPSGNSGDLGCSSGGSSDALVLTIT